MPPRWERKQPARRVRRPMWVITNPVWWRFQGYRIAAAQKMLTARRAFRSVNHHVFQTPNFTASVP